MKIAIGNDHIGLNLMYDLFDYIKFKGIKFKHFGTSTAERMHYPDVAFEVSKYVANNDYDHGILICGSGLGMSVAANKVKGIRAVTCNDPYLAKMARQHNNANIICLGSRVINIDDAKSILDSWFDTNYEGGRHQIRVNMIDNYTN